MPEYTICKHGKITEKGKECICVVSKRSKMKISSENVSLSDLWKEIHYYPYLNRDTWNAKKARERLSEWESKIPNTANCDCSTKWKKLTSLHKPDFSSPENFFEWTVERHNDVNSKLGKPLVFLVDAYASYWNKPLKERPNLIITVATGSYLDYYNIVRPSLHYYSLKINADLLCLVNTTKEWWGYEKFRVQEFVPHYDRTLFVDSDIVISKGCPNVFEMVPFDNVGIHDDMPWIPDREWISPEKTALCDSQGIYRRLDNVQLNTGFVVCNRFHRVWQPPPKPLPEKHCDEQFWVEQTILREGYPYTKLPIEMNTQWWMHDFRKLLPTAQVVHLANSINKTEDLKLAMDEYFYKYSPEREPEHHKISSRF